jgi:hypothetical protein
VTVAVQEPTNAMSLPAGLVVASQGSRDMRGGRDISRGLSSMDDSLRVQPVGGCSAAGSSTNDTSVQALHSVLGVDETLPATSLLCSSIAEVSAHPPHGRYPQGSLAGRSRLNPAASVAATATDSSHSSSSSRPLMVRQSDEMTSLLVDLQQSDPILTAMNSATLLTEPHSSHHSGAGSDSGGHDVSSGQSSLVLPPSIARAGSGRLSPMMASSRGRRLKGSPPVFTWQLVVRHVLTLQVFLAQAS